MGRLQIQSKRFFLGGGLGFAVGSVAKRRSFGLAAVADGQALVFCYLIFLWGLSGIESLVRSVAVRFVSGLPAGAVMFLSRSFLDIIGETFVWHNLS